MTNNSKPKTPIQVIFAVTLLIATVILVLTALLLIFKPSTSAIRLPNSILPTQTLPETTAVLTDTPSPTRTATMTVTTTPTLAPTHTPTLVPTYTLTDQPLPDLTVTGISDPICIHDTRPATEKAYIKLNIIVRNIDRGSTESFGSFSVHINLILGQRHYGLDEWASRFNGVIGISNLDISNLDPNADVELKLAIDLKGNTIFGIESIANSGTNPIPESNTANNTLIQYFSIYCK